MFLGQQLTDLSERRLSLESQLGVEYVALQQVVSGNRDWTASDMEETMERCEKFGLQIGALALDTDSLFRSLARKDPSAEVRLNRALQNIEIAGRSGINCLKYRFQPIGVLRTEPQIGRGGARYPSFNFEQFNGEANRLSPFLADDEPELMLDSIEISACTGWEVLHQFLESAVPLAEEVGVRLAMHPQDAPLPANQTKAKVQHILSSIESLQKFIDLQPSPSNGLNFCQGTVAEMCVDPATEVLDAIRKFGSQGKIVMVHFRNIQGGFLNFREVYPDNGDVDMVAAMKVYKEVGYQGMFCPDHVPSSASDPDGERQFSYCLGYIRGLLQSLDTDTV